VTFGLREHGVEAIVLDIEGTTTPIAFVHQLLFPYARAKLRGFLEEHFAAAAVQETLALLREEWQVETRSGAAPPPWDDRTPAGPVPYLEWLMDRDRKSRGLKRLQGQIWDGGFRSGALAGQVFADVRPAFERWTGAGIRLAIYSSGSVPAQRWLFATTADGDLTRHLSAFFDTSTGPKTSPGSYRRIAGELGIPTSRLLFVSDAPAELDAAREAGCQVLGCLRPGSPAAAAHAAPAIRSFDEIL
jgi:enolase-phosphatase E1